MISQEDMNVLKEFEKTFDDAVNRDFARNLGMRTYRALNDVYEHITGGRYKANGWGCPSCNFKFVKRLGQMYFDELKRLAEETVEKPVEIIEKPKKPAAKKTNDNDSSPRIVSSKANRTNNSKTKKTSKK